MPAAGPRGAGRRWTKLLLALALAAASAQAGSFRRPGSAGTAPAVKDTARAEAVQPPLPEQRPAGAARRAPTPGGVFLRSLVVPGWGQAALARHHPHLSGRGRTGFWVDLGLAAGVWGLARLGQVKEDEYQAYAGRAAGAARHGDGSDYWVDLSNHLSRADFNQAMLEANQPERRYLDPADDWAWPGRAELLRYRDLRAVAERASAQALAAGGAIFINHVLSGVQALRLARHELELGVLPRADGRLAVALVLALDGRR